MGSKSSSTSNSPVGHTSAPNLNAYSSAADVLPLAWSKDCWKSAGMTTLVVRVGQLTHTATSGSKAHFGSDINLATAIIGVGSLL